MLSLRIRSLAVLLSLALLGAAGKAPAKPKPASASAQLAAIVAEYEKIQLEQSPASGPSSTNPRKAPSR
jgi:hypothetical protein